MEKLIIFLVIMVVKKIIDAVNASRSGEQQRPPVAAGPPPSSTPPEDGSVPWSSSDWDVRSKTNMAQQNGPRPPLAKSKPAAGTAVSGRGSRPGKTSSTSPGTASQAKSRPTRASGAGVRAHVESYIGDHVREHMDSHIDASVTQHIDQHVKRHIGTGLSADAEESTLPQSVSEIRSLLQSPDGVRKAMLINEILTRPRSLSRGR